MSCPECGKTTCRCEFESRGPKNSTWSVGYGNETAWDSMPPKVTTLTPRLGVEPFNNSPRQPKIDSK